MSLSNLAGILHDKGRFAEAETARREALAMYRKRLGDDNPAVAASLLGLASDLQKQGKLAEAEASAREALAIREKALPDDWLTFSARCTLGGILLEQKKYTEAEPLLLTGYEGMKKDEAKIPAESKTRLKETLQLLVHLYEDMPQPDKAVEWRKKLAEFSR